MPRVYGRLEEQDDCNLPTGPRRAIQMESHVLPVSLPLSFPVLQVDVLIRFHMCSGKLWLKPLHTSQYPGVKPRNVEAYFKSRSKESLSSLD
jgi:hypothetical protein